MRERKSEGKCSWTVSSELAALGCVEDVSKLVVQGWVKYFWFGGRAEFCIGHVVQMLVGKDRGPVGNLNGECILLVKAKNDVDES